MYFLFGELMCFSNNRTLSKRFVYTNYWLIKAIGGGSMGQKNKFSLNLSLKSNLSFLVINLPFWMKNCKKRKKLKKITSNISYALWFCISGQNFMFVAKFLEKKIYFNQFLRKGTFVKNGLFWPFLTKSSTFLHMRLTKTCCTW